MIKEFLDWIARAKLHATIREMERALKKMECLYENLKTDDFDTFQLAFSIDNRIQECQALIKVMKKRVEKLHPKNFSK